MQTFGRYQLHHRIAVGGMAEIYLARSASLDGFEKTLVIKKMRPDLSADQQFSSMFIDEARISITFGHPNIVQVFDFGKADDSYYLAMEYVHGCDVDALLRIEEVDGQGLDPGLALYIISETCKGLDYAHNHTDREGKPYNVVHRDMSPANIMLSFDGAVKIADFGIAEAKGRITKTQPGIVVGKLSYMSPEQAKGEGVDRRSDIFSCGVVLWEMLTGRNLYAGEMDDDFFARIRDARIDPPSSVNPNVPEGLDALVMKALAPRADERFQTARDFDKAVHGTLVTRYPDVDQYTLQSYLAERRDELSEIVEEDEQSLGLMAAFADRPSATGGTSMVETDARSEVDWSPRLIKAIESFRKHPSLWILVRMGDICLDEGQRDAALVIFRAAAVKFAQAGLLAQCLLCARRMLDLRSLGELRHEIGAMPALEGQTNQAIRPYLFANGGPVEQLLTDLLEDTRPHTGAKGAGTPLLSYLGGTGFAELANAARHLRFAEGELVVEQGELGNTMFLVADGRVLIHANNAVGKRIYLSSLSAGDFFGENSFFTGAPRSANVEALYDVEAFEIDKDLYDRVMDGNAQASEVLLRFYKERIVETVLAVSPVFGVLPCEDRRDAVAQFQLRVFDPGEMIIREGDPPGDVYLIKTGQAEVFTEKGGPRTTLSDIGPGTVFGEVAALRRINRTASVVAKDELEALVLGAEPFRAIFEAKPDIKQKVLEMLAQRARENIDKVMGPSPFAGNLPR